MESQCREDVEDEGSSSKQPRRLLRLRRLVLPIFERLVSNGGIMGKEYDVTFYCEGGQVQAHKIILAMVSTYFADIFKDQKPHKPSVVVIPDIEARTMKQILSLCYHRQVMVNVDNMSEITTWLSILGFGLEKFTFQLSSDRVKAKSGTSITLETHLAGNSEAYRRVPTTTQDNNMRSQKMAAPKSSSLKSIEEGMVDVNPSKHTVTLQANNSSTPIRNSKSPTYWMDTVSVEQRKISQEEDLNRKNTESQRQKFISKPSVVYGVPIQTTTTGVRKFSQECLHSQNENDSQIQSHSSASQGGNVSKLIDSADQHVSHDQTSNVNVKSFDSSDRKEMVAAFVPSTLPSLQSASKKRLVTGRNSSLPRILKGGPVKVSKMQCPVCDIILDDNSKWLWHIAHHQGNGLFKCALCNLSFINAKEVYDHEKMIHNVIGVPDDVAFPDHKYGNIYQKKVPKLKLSKYPRHKILPHGKDKLPSPAAFNMNQSGYAVPKSNKLPKVFRVGKASLLKNSDPSSSVSTSFIRRNRVKSYSGIEDPDKVRWLYACLSCNHSSDSSVKASAHHMDCKAHNGLVYEENVIKYRQGYYGNFSCPLCPRKYITLYGFVVHCIHNHVEYKRSLSHVISEDKLMCVNCGDKFPGPTEFHAHLSPNNRCGRPTTRNKVTRYYRKYAHLSGVDNDKSPTTNNKMVKASEGENGISNSNLDKRNHPFVHHIDPDLESSKEYFKSFLGSNPKSARLQNRLAAAAAACAEPEHPTESQSNLLSSPSKSSGENYPLLSCPVCGCTVENLAEHLIKNHEELSAKIERIDSTIFRCTICFVSFASCDLLAHLKSCSFSEHSELKNNVSNFELTLPTKKIKSENEPKNNSPKRCKVVLKYPESIGKSPLDSMENTDLLSTETLQKAMKCGVCKRASKKLSIISECLKAHGIFRCSLCFNTYLTNEDRLMHLKNCHRDIAGRVKCPICNEVRSNIGQVSSHMYLKHWASFFGRQSIKSSFSIQQESEAALTESDAFEIPGDENQIELLAMSDDTELDSIENKVNIVATSMEWMDSSLNANAADQTPPSGSVEYEIQNNAAAKFSTLDETCSNDDNKAGAGSSFTESVCPVKPSNENEQIKPSNGNEQVKPNNEDEQIKFSNEAEQTKAGDENEQINHDVLPSCSEELDADAMIIDVE